MCLITKNKLTNSGKEEIVCYKVLEYNRIYGHYKTPYFPMVVDQDTIKGKKQLKAENYHGDKKVKLRAKLWNADEYRAKKAKVYDKNAKTAEAGFIHTFKNLEDAKAEVETWHKCGNTFKIFECVIPKNTLYVEGNYFYGSFGEVCKDLNGLKTFASTRIKFIKEVK
jgi:hypothetical protein